MNEIKLLDGNYWNVTDLKRKLIDDNFYYGEGSKLLMSNSGLSDILKSPKTFHFKQKYGSEEDDALRAGWLFHTIILEPKKFEEQIFVDVASKNTKAYKLAKEEHGTVFTKKEKEAAERLADAFNRNSKAVQLLNKSNFEVPTVGEIHGYPFRGKADVLTESGRIIDLKTTTQIHNFPRSAKKWHYDVQVYIYCNLFNVDYKDFIFLALDKGSLDIGIFEVSKDFYLEGKRKTIQAIKMYESFFIHGADLDEYTITGTL